MAEETSLPSLAAAVSPAQRAALERLRQAWLARLRPADAAEQAAVEAIVAQRWRAGRLDAVEERVLAALVEGSPAPGLPSLATVLRARARLEKERRAVEAELEALRAARPRPVEASGRAAQATQAPRLAAKAERSEQPVIARPGAPPAAAAAADRSQDDAARSVADAVELLAAADPAAWAAPRLPREVEDLLATMWSRGAPGSSLERLAATG